MLILTLQFLSSDFELQSPYTFESCCSKLFTLEENGHAEYF